MNASQRVMGVLAVLALGCGGGAKVTPEELKPGGTITVHASAGGALEGVAVTVYAIDPVTGQPIEGRAGGHVLAEASGSSVTGEIKATLGDDVTWSGPIQVVVTGADITYQDPTSEGGSTRVSLPTSFRLTSYVANYASGSHVAVPVTLWTSLSDAAALAYAKGANPSSAAPSPIETALPLIDDLFSKHLSRPQSWDLRASVPVTANANVGSVRDVVFAALADIGLNQLARSISVTAGHEPGAVITAYQLLDLLRADIADGVFDGRGGEAPLAARGGAYELSSRTTRVELAMALGAFIDSAANITGLTREGLKGFSIFDNIALDRSFLYPLDEDPSNFDNLPPALELLEPLPAYVSEAELTVRVRAIDAGAGVARVRATVQNGDAGAFDAVQRDGEWELVLYLLPGKNVIEIWAEDAAVPANSGKGLSAPYLVRGEVLLDLTRPGVSPQTAASYRDEAGAALKRVSEGGLPVVPGALELTGERLNLDGEAIIRKAYVTSSWGAVVPTGAELEAANPRNFPFRQFGVEAADGDPLRSPVESVMWRILATDRGDWGAAEESFGDAIPSARAPKDGHRFYDVVFTQETIPLLRTTTARTVQFRVSLEVTDAAGNTTTSGPFEHAYELLDTPLAFVVDTAYPTRMSEVGSLFRYKAKSSRYGDLFTSGEGDFKGIARLGLVRIYNPWPTPVTIEQSNERSFGILETWVNQLIQMETDGSAPNEVRVGEGEYRFRLIQTWDSIPGSGLYGASLEEASCAMAYNDSDSVCGRGWKHTRRVVFYPGSGATGGYGNLSCEIGAPVDDEMKLTWGQTLRASHASAWVNPEVQQFEGRHIVPAASGATAGHIAFYPGVPRDEGMPFSRPGGLMATWNGERNQQIRGLVYRDQGNVHACFTGELGGMMTNYYVTRYRLNSWTTFLESAKATLTGSQLTFSVRPLYVQDGSTFEGGPLPAQTPVPFSVAVSL